MRKLNTLDDARHSFNTLQVVSLWWLETLIRLCCNVFVLTSLRSSSHSNYRKRIALNVSCLCPWLLSRGCLEYTTSRRSLVQLPVPCMPLPSEAVRSRVRSQASSSRKKKTATSLHSRASDESPREHYRRKTRHSNNKSKSPTRRKKDGESSKIGWDACIDLRGLQRKRGNVVGRRRLRQNVQRSCICLPQRPEHLPNWNRNTDATMCDWWCVSCDNVKFDLGDIVRGDS